MAQEIRFLLTHEQIQELCSVVSHKVCNIIVEVWREALDDAVSEETKSWIEDRAIELVSTGGRADFTLQHEDLPWLIPPGAVLRVTGSGPQGQAETPEELSFLASFEADEPSDD